ncbi:class I SAM-dependent methyltransferase [Cryptosporidium felis]|nr:class I SAM-dependent methyltransferase [Cryptosporidium felis]
MKVLTIVDYFLAFVWLTYWHLKSLLNVAPFFWRFCYNSCNKLFTKLQYTNNIDVSFMNYGYAIRTPHCPPENAELDKFIESKLEKLKKDSPPSFNDVWNSVQLYTAVLSTYDDDLKGKSILEVGCGRGGGSVVICSAAEPKSYAGIDISDQGIEICRQVYRNDLIPAGNKVFYVGNSMELENYFAPESFDIVLNVESAHCYPNFDKFVKGVFELLKPGGMMLFADISPTVAWPDIKDTITNSGFHITREYNITANVIHSLKTEVEPFLSKINSKSSSSMIGKALMWLVNSQTVRIPLDAMIKGDGQYQIIACKKPVQFNKSGTTKEEKSNLIHRNITK